MAGFKRGGFRGGASGAYKKGASKKRAGPDDEDSAPRASKKSKGDEEEEDSAPVVPELKADGEGCSFVGLNASGKRRVIVREFKDVPLVDIREFWVDGNGDLKPGKKGISLTTDQYITLLTAAPLIEAALAKKNIQVPRPDYDADFSAPNAPEDKEKADDAAEDEVKEAVGKADNDEEDEE
ncbi:PC4-domain-containing protein [Ophiobolus disseminans]|uniref:PC4-domain-containing protein n=1 Tax=Ophiobolus disseminans TaxID=1469910 RepID=A0A6A6ZQG3_9PLEO|nr:PC4-domain-containing protein [Ophiobolus disseminans]